MAIDERTRRDLHHAFDELLGPDRAEALMTLLPAVGWADVATRQDLALLENALRQEIRGELSGLRAEMASLEGSLRTQMADLGSGLRAEMAELRTDFNGRVDGLEVRFHQELTRATRTMVFSLTSSVFVVGSLAFAAASLV